MLWGKKKEYEFEYDIAWWQYPPQGLDTPAFLIAQFNGLWCAAIFDEHDKLIFCSPGWLSRNTALDLLWVESYKRYKTLLDTWAVEWRKTH